ncbi:MAG: hypothetical protein GX107_00760 [Clostridiales bacterium]|nr:hypothetical protein [Clostridiales bacterium]
MKRILTARKTDRFNLRLLPAAAGTVCFAVLLLRFPAQTASGVRYGLTLCGESVLPSIFPFTVLCSFMIYSGLSEWLGGVFSSVTRFLFRLSGESASAVLVGLFGGYPVGARMTALLLKRGLISKSDAYKLSLFCINAGPAFVIGTVGVAMTGSRRAGVILFASLCAASLITGFLTRFVAAPADDTPVPCPENTVRMPLNKCLTEAVSEAVPAMLSICSWVMLFSCICSVASLLPERLSGAALTLKCVLEVTTGCAEAVKQGISLPLLAAVLGWSGLSVQCQVLRYVMESGISIPVLTASRALNGAMASFVCCVILKYFPCGTEVFLNNVYADPAGLSLSLPAALGLMLTGVLLILDTLPEISRGMHSVD